MRSFMFVVQMYLVMGVMGVVFLPWALVYSGGASQACRLYCHWVRWSAARLIGLHFEFRGPVPRAACLIAAKHQSFLDILMIFLALPAPRFIMKRELLYAPVLGQYAWRLGCVPVNRGAGAKAIIGMLQNVVSGGASAGQLVIYPQGTRVPPGRHMPYKSGVYALYERLDQACIPVATNAGVFWPRRGIYRKPGTAVVAFLPAIAPGLAQAEFMSRLQTTIETHSEALVAEARSSLSKRATHRQERQKT
ncbi:MAG: 1-acyl-sn-glycerol-3-phosphate acyltransferase [Rhodobacteraceae bacterium]|nr:1-acyl-sn-glycerol-3-phosphate acyltransferase [Paracoccaceae bacterium]